METISTLTSRHARAGTLQWIGIRPQRHENLIAIDEVSVLQTGLEGDHYQSGGKRAVTLIQYEHLAVIASLLDKPSVHPGTLRRNLVVSGINLLGLRNREFSIGNVILKGTGICAPCSRMENALGPGGYTSVRGHGGITASVVNPGSISIGDQISPV